MTRHIMLDLETLDSGSTAAVVSIGAIAFNRDQVFKDDTFYAAIDMEDAAKYGTISAATMRWWLQQSDPARDKLITGVEKLSVALERFAGYVRGADGVWGFGATFDNVILRNAYNKVGFACPWHYRQDRCFRTLSQLVPVVWPGRVGVHHNALDDATTQAIVAQQILAKLP